MCTSKTSLMALTVHACDAERSSMGDANGRRLGSSDSEMSDNKVWSCSVHSGCQTFCHSQRKPKITVSPRFPGVLSSPAPLTLYIDVCKHPKINWENFSACNIIWTKLTTVCRWKKLRMSVDIYSVYFCVAAWLVSGFSGECLRFIFTGKKKRILLLLFHKEQRIWLRLLKNL